MAQTEAVEDANQYCPVAIATEILGDRWTPLIRFENQQLLNLPIRKHIYMRRGAIASDKVRAPGPALDDATKRDLEALLARLDIA